MGCGSIKEETPVLKYMLVLCEAYVMVKLHKVSGEGVAGVTGDAVMQWVATVGCSLWGPL